MTEFIERKAAIDACFDGWNNDARDCAENIRAIPAADVRPVVRGYWHGEGDGYADGELVCDMWQCSCCGEWFDEWDDKPTWSFCPNCGADMRNYQPAVIPESEAGETDQGGVKG